MYDLLLSLISASVVLFHLVYFSCLTHTFHLGIFIQNSTWEGFPVASRPMCTVWAYPGLHPPPSQPTTCPADCTGTSAGVVTARCRTAGMRVHPGLGTSVEESQSSIMGVGMLSWTSRSHGGLYRSPYRNDSN